MATQDLSLDPSGAGRSGTAHGEGVLAPQSYHIWTIGCQMNQADSERLGSALGQMGLSEAPSPEEADVVVLNSCVVRQSAEERVVGNLGLMKPLKARRPGRVLALMGCMVGPRQEELRARFPYVDLFMAPQQYQPLLEMVGHRLGIDPEGCIGSLAPPRPSVAAYVPVIHGCDLFCTFCIIPYRRGRQASRPIPELVREVELLAARGVKEVTLLGQTVDAYGHDLPGGGDLADLLYTLDRLPGLERIRFLTSHPSFLSDRIIRAVAEAEKVCEHVNLPVQAGDDRVLAAMRRGYTRDDYLRLVDRIRDGIPGASLSTDVIVGFCDETEEQFQGTLELLERVRFDKVHVAAYSPRPGTIAERRLPDAVPAEEKRRRLREVEALQERIATEANARLLGETVRVLVEGRERGRWKGRTRTDRLAFFDGDGGEWHGKTVDVRVTWTGPWCLLGAPEAPARAGGVRRW